MHAFSCTFLRRGAALLLCAPLAAAANPTGGTVAAGAATISHSGGTTTITQGTDRAVINWNDFNIGAGELTRFVQPGASSAVLNRVTGGNPTQIFGRLEGNGRVFVLNPNGVLVGAGGVVQTQGFIGSTLNVADRDFMAGGDLRFTGDAAATVANLGHIDAGQGDAVLIAQRVRNAGDISSGGTVGLAAGNDVLLAREGDTRIWVKSGVTGAGGTGVDHTGTISSVQAELKAAGGNMYSIAVNSSGLVSATGVTERGGRIYLTSEGGNVEVSGTLVARKAGGAGGEIYVGGGYQGKDAGLANAANTTVTSTSRLDAGNAAAAGGRVVVWADGRTNYAGALETGGVGEAEVSGKGTLDFTGTVNTRGGRLLLDPTDITIDNSNFAALIGNPLLTGAVTLSATNDITYDTSNPIQSNFTLVWDAGRDVNFAPTSAFGSMGAGNNVDFQVYAGRDFNMAAASGITFSSGGKALIRAGRDITMGASATISFGAGGWVLLSADTANSTRPASGPGKITLESTAYLNATKIQAFAPSPAQFINNSMVSFATPTYDTWEGDFSVSGTGSGLWFKSNSSGTFAPTTSSLLITANNFSRTYGSGNPVFTASYTGLTNGDDSSVVTGLQFATTATLGSNVGTYSITPFGASAPAYYDLSYAPGTLTITRAALTVGVNDVARVYGDPNPQFTVNFTGLRNGDVGSQVVSALQFSTAAALPTPVGAYPVSLSGGAAQNYTLSLQPGTITVTPAPLTIKANDASRMQGAVNPAFTATYTGFKNSDTAAVVSNLTFGTPATPSSGAGNYAITPGGASAANYALTYQPGTLTVNPQLTTEVDPTATVNTVTTGGTFLIDLRTPEQKYVDAQLEQMKSQQNYGGMVDLADTVRMVLEEKIIAYRMWDKSDDFPAGVLEQASGIMNIYLQYLQEFGFTRDVVGYADTVHGLMPAWFEMVRDKYQNDPRFVNFFKQPYAADALTQGCAALAVNFRTNAELQLTDKVTALMGRAAKLDQQIATMSARIAALDASFAAGAPKPGDTVSINVADTVVMPSDKNVQNTAEHDRLMLEMQKLVQERNDPALDAFRGSLADLQNPPKPGERDYLLAAVGYLVNAGILTL